jgi:signal transduction histidine kinase
MIEFIFSGTTNPIKLNKDFEIKLYFVVSELINNIIKHSEANSAKITYEINEKFLKLIVQDNGIGMYNYENKKGGLGLQQTSTRIFGLNGEMLIENSNGLKINITIPLDSEAISEFNNL